MLDHWPMIIIVYTEHSPRYMAIVAPNLMEWVPNSCFAIPRRASVAPSVRQLDIIFLDPDWLVWKLAANRYNPAQ